MEVTGLEVTLSLAVVFVLLAVPAVLACFREWIFKKHYRWPDRDWVDEEYEREAEARWDDRLNRNY